jgi:aspartyl-tRNA(Asn)/glutamyl-tRNA(Gln) amidotransferase subunit B
MYEPIIGLEIHLQAKTKSKMFCRCSTDYFGKLPNTHVCQVCMGLPGALPVANKEAIKKCIKLGLALNCNINKVSKFDRKNYFYPDLAKGYQISQYDIPFAYDGYVEIDIQGDARRIRITRVHMEEDTGKSSHEHNLTLIDYNKSGMPLIEIVTEPDFVDKDEVTKFAKRLRQIVRYLDISDANMEKGQLRFELNMSLREVGKSGLPNYKVEVKNIGSISVLEKVIEFEFARQKEILLQGNTPVQETRGLRDLTGVTYSQRLKEDAQDYRYFPEPDLPTIKFSDQEINEIAGQLIELPQDKKFRYMQDYKFEPDLAELLVSVKANYQWFEQAIENISSLEIIKETAKLMIGDVFGMLKADKLKLSKLKFSPKYLAEVATMIINGDISRTLAKQKIIPIMYKSGNNPQEIIKQEGLDKTFNDDELNTIIDRIIENNPKIIKDAIKNPNAIKSLLGQVMRETKGQADPNKILKLLENKIL